MAKTLARVTGKVLDVTTRSGTSKAGNDYTLQTASIIVANRAVIEVTLGFDQEAPSVGSDVDWLVSLQTFRTEVQAQFDSDLNASAGRRSAPVAAAS